MDNQPVWAVLQSRQAMCIDPHIICIATVKGDTVEYASMTETEFRNQGVYPFYGPPICLRDRDTFVYQFISLDGPRSEKFTLIPKEQQCVCKYVDKTVYFAASRWVEWFPSE